MGVDRDGKCALDVANRGAPVARRVLLPEVIEGERARSEGATLVVEDIDERDVDRLVHRRSVHHGKDELARMVFCGLTCISG